MSLWDCVGVALMLLGLAAWASRDGVGRWSVIVVGASYWVTIVGRHC